MIIRDIQVREIFDSRADITLEFEVAGDKARACAGIPAGRSRGGNEVITVDYGRAKSSIDKARKKLIGKSFSSIKSFDEALKELDNTRRKEKIGGNVALGLSVAFTKLLAGEKEPWEVIQKEFFGARKSHESGTNGTNTRKQPAIFANFIEGGAHAKNNLDIQEYLVVAESGKSIRDTIKKLITLYRKLHLQIEKSHRLHTIPIGDEGGIDENFRDNFKPIQILTKLIKSEKLEREFKIGLDAAANHFQKGKEYTLKGKKLERKELQEIYKTYKDETGLLYSIEDPFGEKDEDGFRELQAECEDLLIIGDDITTTDPETIERAAKEKLITGVIIKPNQIGTVTETCEAIQAAKNNNLKFVISHRAGETEGVFIIQLARASSADGVKIGAPYRERIDKYNELLRLYE